MLDKKDTTLIKLDCKSKDKVYDMLFGKADACLKNAKTVALLYLGSPYYMTRALEEYNIEEVNIFTTKDFKFIYEPFENAKRAKIWYVDNVKDTFKECDMKFDCIIMNPPYQRNLHLKILAEAIKHLKDDKSVCVNLSPVRWLQDPLAKYKKTSDLKRFEESVAKHIESLDIIDKGISGDAFNIGINSDLGIYKCNSKGGWNYESICWNYNNTNFSFFEKLISISKTVGSLKNIASTDISKGIAVPFNIFGGGSGGRTFNGEYVSKILATNEEKNNFLYGRKKQDGWNSKRFFIGAVFNTLIEAQNFKNFITSALMRCFGIVTIKNMHIDNSWAFVPNLYNAINPRTGLKGYQGEWTDDDLYKFFNITPEEQKVIEDTMEKYR